MFIIRKKSTKRTYTKSTELPPIKRKPRKRKTVRIFKEVKDFKRPKRPVSRVFVHCSASDHASHDDVEVMDRWHRQRGWSGVGYHYFIKKDGTVQEGRSLERNPAAQRGHNRATIAICLHGLKESLFTKQQMKSLRHLCRQIKYSYKNKVTFHGHREVAAKDCPVFDYKAELKLDKHGKLGI